MTPDQVQAMLAAMGVTVPPSSPHAHPPSGPPPAYPPPAYPPSGPPPAHPPMPALPDLSGVPAGVARGQRLPAGSVCDVEIDEVRFGRTFYGLQMFVEFRVLAVHAGTAVVGASYYWSINLEGADPRTRERALSEAKGWICESIDRIRPGTDAANHWEQGLMAWIAGPDQPAKGQKWRITTWDKGTQSGRTFLVHAWEAA